LPSDTFFRNADATAMAGKQLEVEGTVTGGVLLATKIAFEKH
jgi:hypothetical protein